MYNEQLSPNQEKWEREASERTDAVMENRRRQQDLAERARVIVIDRWDHENKIAPCNFEHCAASVATSLLSDAQHHGHFQGNRGRDHANDLINMAKVLTIDISGLNHPSPPHREEHREKLRQHYGTKIIK